MGVTLTDKQLTALLEVLPLAIAGSGMADDCDEIVADMIESGNNTPDELRVWAGHWDTAIAFFNEHCELSQKMSDPWVTKELESQLAEQPSD
jgi:hypothetical protein